MDSEISAGWKDYAGLFCTTSATIIYEVLLTRIFSVTMWYHFAFMAISVAMFGMTAGAILVFLLPDFFQPENVKLRMAQSSLLFALSLVICFLSHLCIPFAPDSSFLGIYSIVFTYVLLAIPFVFSGVCVCLALTRLPRRVSQLYAADLAGAAVGCILFYGVMHYLDGISAVFFVAIIAGAGAILFAISAGRRTLARLSLFGTVVFEAFVILNGYLAWNQNPLIRLMWVKNRFERPGIYETWNSFSRIKVFPVQDISGPALGWGMSDAYPRDRFVKSMQLNIDATAGTKMISFDGDRDKLDFLRYDIVNLAHYLRPRADVLVVGNGGGRDVLSALAFGQKSVTAVELNGEIINTVNGVFGDFTGHLDQLPNVRFINDEARSYLTRNSSSYDLLQISMIDTWAATASGAFVLSENALYTVEAWGTFLDRLKAGGVLTVSRWYIGGLPGSMYRCVALAARALRDRGIGNPREHIAVVSTARLFGDVMVPDGAGTLLVSKSPFSPGEIGALRAIAGRLGFLVVFDPGTALDENYATLVASDGDADFYRRFQVDITPPTDNRPFFFNMLKFRDIFKDRMPDMGSMTFNLRAVKVLGILLLTVIVLTLLCVIAPLAAAAGKKTLRHGLVLSLFFAGIGLGFMFIEIGQMQRLMIFLGHPTYALTVVLFSLLLASGLGSLITGRITVESAGSRDRLLLVLLLAALAAAGLLTPWCVSALRAASNSVRIASATGLLLCIGFFMGMAFPLGMKLASRRAFEFTPWLWGVNGAASIIASVGAVVISMAAGISATYWTGWFCYCAAVAVYFVARSRGLPTEV